MITTETFVVGLLLMSALTGLATEAIKNMFNELKIKYSANTLAGIVSLILSPGVGVCYIVATEMIVTPQVVVQLVALMFMSWLCAMVGYDKVVQTISQFKSHTKE